MSTCATSFDAEVAAIELAVKRISETPLKIKKIVIFCDCTSAIELIKCRSQLFKNLETSLRQQNKILELDWIPSKTGGNIKADLLAKAAAKKPSPPDSTSKNKAKSALNKTKKSKDKNGKQALTKDGLVKQPVPNSDLPPAKTVSNTAISIKSVSQKQIQCKKKNVSVSVMLNVKDT